MNRICQDSAYIHEFHGNYKGSISYSSLMLNAIDVEAIDCMP